MLVGGCFAEHGIHTVDTRDDKGAWRYLAMSANNHYNFVEGGTWLSTGLLMKYGIESLPGLSGVSEHSVAIHLKNAGKWGKPIDVPEMMFRYHVTLHNLC